MSRYEWEEGTITLPTGVAPKLKAHLQRAALDLVPQLRAETDIAWARVKGLRSEMDRAVELERMQGRGQLSWDAQCLMLKRTVDTKTGKLVYKVSRPSE